VDREHAAGRRRRRRLIAAIIALALGATLGAAAPQAFAGPKEAKQRDEPSITLTVNPRAARTNRHIDVSGRVWPVEVVGENVTLSVQRKAPRGRWTPVTLAGLQVFFYAPLTWEGTLTTEITGPTASLQSWTGRVTYELWNADPDTDRINVGHYAEYSMTKATGTYTWTDGGEDWKGDKMQHWSLTYSGTPVQDSGSLRWYFAEATVGAGTIPIDSYEATAVHALTGVLVVTWEDGTVETLPGIASGVAAWIWPDARSPEAPRPVLEPGGLMRGSYVRTDSPSAGFTESSRWVLEPSDYIFYDQLGRSGFYDWEYTPTKKGLYRVRVSGAQTADHRAFRSSWHKVTVR